MIKAIIFDCFGVLAGSGFQDTYRQAGGDIEADKDFINDILHAVSAGMITSENFIKQITERLDITPERWSAVVREAESPNLHLFDWIREHGPDYKIGLLSNANHGVMQQKFNPNQLGLFDAVIVSAEVGFLKPDPQIYLLTAERLGVEPAECLFVDDNARHCAGAVAIGMQAIEYNNFDQFLAELQKLL